MTKASPAPSHPAIIVYGQSSIGKPKAGLFKGTEVQAARKAADKLGLRFVEIADPASQAIAAKVPIGRIQGHGDAIIPFVARQLYLSIESLTSAKPSNGASQPAESKIQTPRLPLNWDDIKVGDRVLAQDTDPRDGWWQVTVVEKIGDIFKLRWPGRQHSRPFQKHRTALGLICPHELDPEPEKPKGSASKPGRFPDHWAAIAIDHIVLAKEDGPCEQWWEARTIKLDKGLFTLEWRETPALPAILRPRSSLGLVHPAPKTR